MICGSAVVARSTFPSQNVQSTPGLEHFWKLRCWKSARRCGAKQAAKWKCLKYRRVRTTFGRSDVISRGRRKGLCTLSKVSKTWGFCSISSNDGRRGAFEEDPQRCISHGKRGTRDTFIRDVTGRRSGHWGVAFWSIRSSGLLRWFCVTGAALRMAWHHFCLAGALL